MYPCRTHEQVSLGFYATNHCAHDCAMKSPFRSTCVVISIVVYRNVKCPLRGRSSKSGPTAFKVYTDH